MAETFTTVGDIAANLLHRVNNQVGTIPVRVEGIQDKCAAALAANSYLATNLEQIERSAAEAMAVIHDTLFHLRPIHLMPVHLADCVQEAIAESHLPPTVRIKTVGLDGLPTVYAGPRRLSLVFTNLLENAATAMEGAGVITLCGAASSTGWRCRSATAALASRGSCTSVFLNSATPAGRRMRASWASACGGLRP